MAKFQFVFLAVAFLSASCSRTVSTAGNTVAPGTQIGDATSAGVKETHGGDLIALYFTKSGRNIIRGIEGHPEWALSRSVDLRALTNAVDSTEVESTDDPTVFCPFGPSLSASISNSHIWIYRKGWMQSAPTEDGAPPRMLDAVPEGSHEALSAMMPSTDLSGVASSDSCVVQVPFVLRQYLAVSSQRDITATGTLDDWKSLCLRPLNDPSRPQSTLDLRSTAKNLNDDLTLLADLLEKNPDWQISGLVNSNDLRKKIAGVSLKLYDDHIGIALGGASKDAENFSDGEVIFPIYRFLSEGETLELLLHELAPLAGYDDSRYQISSRLFLDLPSPYYY